MERRIFKCSRVNRIYPFAEAFIVILSYKMQIYGYSEHGNPVALNLEYVLARFINRLHQLVDGISKLLLRYTLGVQFAFLGFHILTKLIYVLSMCHHTFYLFFQIKMMLAAAFHQ